MAKPTNIRTFAFVKYNKWSARDCGKVVQIIKGDHRLSDIRPLVRFNVLVIVEKDGRTERGKKLQTKRKNKHW